MHLIYPGPSLIWFCAGCFRSSALGHSATVAAEPTVGNVQAKDAYRLKPIPPALEKVRGVHPRIYLTRERIEELRRRQDHARRHLEEGPGPGGSGGTARSAGLCAAR